MAQRLGVSKATVRNWEANRNQPGIGKRQEVVDFLGYPLPREDCPKPRTLGQRLRTRRLELDLTQKELAQRFHVDPTTIWKWEHDRTRPPVRYLPSIAQLVGQEELLRNAGLGKRIRAYRSARGLTQAQLGARLGVSQTTISDWEQDRLGPDSRHPGLVERLK